MNPCACRYCSGLQDHADADLIKEIEAAKKLIGDLSERMTWWSDRWLKEANKNKEFESALKTVLSVITTLVK